MEGSPPQYRCQGLLLQIKMRYPPNGALARRAWSRTAARTSWRNAERRGSWKENPANNNSHVHVRGSRGGFTFRKKLVDDLPGDAERKSDLDRVFGQLDRTVLLSRLLLALLFSLLLLLDGVRVRRILTLLGNVIGVARRLSDRFGGSASCCLLALRINGLLV